MSNILRPRVEAKWLMRSWDLHYFTDSQFNQQQGLPSRPTVWTEVRQTQQQSISPTGYLQVCHKNNFLPYNLTVTRTEEE
jgi:hypothetical protein